VVTDVIVWVVLLALGVGAGLVAMWYYERRQETSAAQRAKQLLSEAEDKADGIRKEVELKAKEELFNRREEFEKETLETRNELRNFERRLAKREDNIERKADVMSKKEKQLEQSEAELAQRQQELTGKRDELQKLVDAQKETLQRISGLTREQAQEMVLTRLEKELQKEQGELVHRYTEQTKEMAEAKRRAILSTALQRLAADHTVESVVSTIDLPNDEMKGRIIGREGRNIRSFERATGVDVIVDDTPGVVVISGFDSVRREVAKVALEHLIVDGRIHPARIEEVVENTRKQIDEIIRESGKQAMMEADIHGLHPKELELLGRLKYRTSYGQNVLRHSLEVAHLMGALAGEMGLDPVLARRVGLLHDIGKAVDHETEGGHPEIGADLARRYGEDPLVVNAIEAHHEKVPAESVYAVLAMAADAVSASRPGARRETLENYIKRLERLETLAKGFPGVSKAYAIQAGREVRVIADADKLDDKSSAMLARDIAREIEKELTYPGEVRVTVIRETRITEVAH